MYFFLISLHYFYILQAWNEWKQAVRLLERYSLSRKTEGPNLLALQDCTLICAMNSHQKIFGEDVFDTTPIGSANNYAGKKVPTTPKQHNDKE